MCDGFGITGMSRSLRVDFTARVCSCCSTRSRLCCAWYSMAVLAPAMVAGGSDVVKMNPGASERMVSTSAADPAMYPPTQP